MVRVPVQENKAMDRKAVGVRVPSTEVDVKLLIINTVFTAVINVLINVVIINALIMNALIINAVIINALIMNAVNTNAPRVARLRGAFNRNRTTRWTTNSSNSDHQPFEL